MALSSLCPPPLGAEHFHGEPRRREASTLEEVTMDTDSIFSGATVAVFTQVPSLSLGGLVGLIGMRVATGWAASTRRIFSLYFQ